MEFETLGLDLITPTFLTGLGFKTSDDKQFAMQNNSGNVLLVEKHHDTINWSINLDSKHLFISSFSPLKFKSLLIGLGFIVEL